MRISIYGLAICCVLMPVSAVACTFSNNMTLGPGWTAVPCTQSGGGHSGSGGGASYRAAGAAIGFLGVLIESAQQAEQSEQNAANEGARRRWAYCQSRYHTAHDTNEEARQIFTNGDPEAAFTKFEQALDSLGSCGSARDLAKLRNNLENARREYLGLTTPSSGISVYGADAPKKMMILPHDLVDRAAAGCSNFAEGTPEQETCFRKSEAGIIMASDGDSRIACQAIVDVDKRDQCLFNAYWATVNGSSPNADDRTNCYWDEHGRPCNSGGESTPPQAATSDHNGLRNELNKALNEQAKQNSVADARTAAIAQAKALRDSLPVDSADRKHLDEVIAKAEAGQIPPAQTPAATGATTVDQKLGREQAGIQDRQDATPDPMAEPSRKSINDQAYENYMQSKNSSSGGTNSGDLGLPHPGLDGLEPAPIGDH